MPSMADQYMDDLYAAMDDASNICTIAWQRLGVLSRALYKVAPKRVIQPYASIS